MFAAQGVLAALLARERTGRGQAVDIGMLDATAALLTYQAGNYFTTGEAPDRLGNRHPTIAPYEIVRHRRRRPRHCRSATTSIWRRSARRRTARPSGPTSASRPIAVAWPTTTSCKAVLDEVRVETHTRDEWLEHPADAGVPCGSVREISEVLNDPQLQERAMVAELHHSTIGPINVIGSPIKLSATPSSIS